MAAELRERMNADPVLDPMDLFAHVYAEQTGAAAGAGGAAAGRAGRRGRRDGARR